MYSNKSKQTAYKETRIKTASQGRLIVMLYDEAIRQIDIAIEKIAFYATAEGLDKVKAIEPIHLTLTKAQEILSELASSLDFEKGGELAHNLYNIYMFSNRKLMEANLNKDSSDLPKVKAFLSDLREAWNAIDANKPDPTRGALNVAG